MKAQHHDQELLGNIRVKTNQDVDTEVENTDKGRAR